MLFKRTVGRVGISVAVLTTMAVVVAGGAASASQRELPQPSHESILDDYEGRPGRQVQPQSWDTPRCEILFDNVHFNRDNPNVPSDIEMIPSLEQFIEANGTMLSNNHTPLIAHTADDSITTYTGLYGDRAGMPVSNSFQSYNVDGTTDPADSFAYWTDPIFDTASSPNAGHDTNPSMVYSPVPPATSPITVVPNKVTPAPWVPFTRGAATSATSPGKHGAREPFGRHPQGVWCQQPGGRPARCGPGPLQGPQTADYVGLAIHCAKGATLCASARAVKFDQTTPSPTAVADLLPDEPGGYNGYQVLFGSKYIAPTLGAGSPDLSHNGYQVTDAAGNLVDENGDEIDGAYRPITQASRVLAASMPPRRLPTSQTCKSPECLSPTGT